MKARVHASQTKQMLLAFFDSKGVVYTHIMPKGPPSTPTTCWWSWTSSWCTWGRRGRRWWRETGSSIGTHTVHTAAVVKNWLATKEIQLAPHSPLFAWFGTNGLLLVPESERTAGWPSPDPGEPQEHVGRGNVHHWQRRVRHRLPAVVRVQSKVRLGPGQLCWEKLRNKHLANSYRCLFIKHVKFVCDLTSYA